MDMGAVKQNADRHGKGVQGLKTGKKVKIFFMDDSYEQTIIEITK